MTTTTKTKAAPIAPPAPATEKAPGTSGRRVRRPGVLIAGAGLAILGGLGAATMAASAGDRRPVLVAAQDVAAGHTITAQDLTEALVAVDAGVSVLPAEELDQVVGQVAAAALPAGSLLAAGDLVPEGPPTAGQVVVPLPVTTTMMPAAGLEPGDRLLVVDTPLAQADPTPGDPQEFPVEVTAISPPDVNGVVVVDVAVDSELGSQVAKRAATGRFVLVVQPASEATP